jgi:hypothetical protein
MEFSLHSLSVFYVKEPIGHTDWRRLIMAHTLKELLIIFLPIFIYTVLLAVPTFVLVDPKYPFLLVSLVNPKIFEWFHHTLFGLLVVMEFIVFYYYLFVVWLSFFVFYFVHRLPEDTQIAIADFQEQ